MRTMILFLLSVIGIAAQTPPIEPGVSHELAKWRAARYSDVRYKLNLTLEKMSPVLKGTMEIRVKVSEPPASAGGQKDGLGSTPIVLDWRKIRGSEQLSTISNVSLNGNAVSVSSNWPPANAGGSDFAEHLIFRDGVVIGENVIKLDFTSPILTSGSAITRYVDKEDGAEYIYSLFVPSDASTAFPVFDQPDLKARFQLEMTYPRDWRSVSNAQSSGVLLGANWKTTFQETQPISTYVFAFAAGKFELFKESTAAVHEKTVRLESPSNEDTLKKPLAPRSETFIYVRKSQAAKFKPHAAEVFRLNREGVKFLETYFDYKFPFPKYDLVLIPEFPFGGMEHAGATFLREASIIFPTEPTKSDHISRANLIFHEAAHQWFGNTVTMKWFDDLWLKEGFAEFMAYKTLEKVMPEANAWKVFYERNKQAAYLTDSTRGTTPIYQKIDNLSAAKSAYGNIVYRKAPSFLKQAEFYLGADKFQTAVRAFLKKYEYGNAGWEDLVKEFETASAKDLRGWANRWINQRGAPVIRVNQNEYEKGKRSYYSGFSLTQSNALDPKVSWLQSVSVLEAFSPTGTNLQNYELQPFHPDTSTLDPKVLDRLKLTEYPMQVIRSHETLGPRFLFANYQDYGYGIFLLDDKSRDYVLKNIHYEKDAFLRSMMWGALWDSVREGELDPAVYVELAVKNLDVQSASFSLSSSPQKKQAKACTLNCGETDETIIQSLLGRVSTALNYYIAKGEPPASAGGLARPTTNSVTPKRSDARPQPPAYAGGSSLNARFEAVLLDRLQNAPTAGQRITFYRSFVANASTAKGREVLKQMLRQGSLAQGEPPASAGGLARPTTNSVTPKRSDARPQPPAYAGGSPLRTKDRFDIVQRLIILSDPDALKLLADLEKTETSDDSKRYAYAARAGLATDENKAKYWNDFVNNKGISESWIEAAFGPWNSIRHADLTFPYLQKALQELPNHKRNRKIFFVNGWLSAFISGQRSEKALAIVNKFLADNPTLDNDLRLKILENVDLIERAVKIRAKYGKN